MKTIFRFILLWLILFVVALIFILPETNVYKSALKTFDEVVESQTITVPPPPQDMPYRYGFVFGYIFTKFPLVLVAIVLLPFISAGFFLFLFKWLWKEKKSSLLSDPFESIKNVLSHLLLFMFGIFNRRASNQLSPYFDLSVRSRFIGVLAYALVLIAITFSYKMPSDFAKSGFIWFNYLQVLFIVALISLTFFSQKFRVNYQRRLFWLSFSALLLVLTASSIIGYHLAKSQVQINQTLSFTSPIFDPHIMLVNILVVLGFSFYIEIMKQVAAQKASIEAEVDVARRIQNDLLPELNIENDVLSLYGRTIAANEVGGDYCDAVELQDKRYAVAVGDVSGHNVSAGVMMSMLKIAFRTELAYLSKPEAMIASLNKNMYDHKNKNMFVSLVKTLINPAEKTLTIMNCGHPPLLVYSAKNNAVDEIRTGDIALALQRDASFSSQEMTYQSGDFLVLFSDGLIETMSTSGDELGIEPVIGILKNQADRSARDIYEALFAVSQNFRGSVQQRDDVTIVVVKLK